MILYRDPLGQKKSLNPIHFLNVSSHTNKTLLAKRQNLARGAKCQNIAFQLHAMRITEFQMNFRSFGVKPEKILYKAAKCD